MMNDVIAGEKMKIFFIFKYFLLNSMQPVALSDLQQIFSIIVIAFQIVTQIGMQ